MDGLKKAFTEAPVFFTLTILGALAYATLLWWMGGTCEAPPGSM